MKYFHAAARRVRARLSRLFRAAVRWWSQRRVRMADEVGYADALVAVALAAVELLPESHRARDLTHRLVAAYVAVLRALAPQRGWEAA